MGWNRCESSTELGQAQAISWLGPAAWAVGSSGDWFTLPRLEEGSRSAAQHPDRLPGSLSSLSAEGAGQGWEESAAPLMLSKP